MTTEAPLSKGVFRIDPTHVVDAFDCGTPALNDFLKRHAVTNDKNGSARTFVALRGKRVAGFFSLAASSVAWDEADERLKRGLARHPVPVVLVARLAVDGCEKGHGLGEALLKQAMLKAVTAADSIGARAIAAQAKDETARAFYARYSFTPAAFDPMFVWILFKDVRKSLKTTGDERPSAASP